MGGTPDTISVIVPTVEGREAYLEDCVAAYETTTPNVEVIVIRNGKVRDQGELRMKTCGEAWIAGAKKARGAYLHFTADDLIPLEGWWEQAVAAVRRDQVPVANVLTRRRADGTWYDSMYSMSFLVGDRPTPNVLVPFLSRPQFELGEWLLPIHYGSDDWVTFLADRLHLPTVECPSYVFGHNAAPEGRAYDTRKRDIPILVEKMAEHGRVPAAYLAYLPALGLPTFQQPVVGPGVQLGQDDGYTWNGPVINPALR